MIFQMMYVSKFQGFNNNADADAALQANLKCFKLEEEKRLLKKEVDDLKMSLTNQSDLFEQKQSELKKHFEDYRKWCFSATKNPKVQPQPPTCFPVNDFQISLGRNQSSQEPRNIPQGTPTKVPIQIPNQNPQGKSSVSYTGSNLKDLKHPILGYSIPISPIPQSPLPLSPPPATNRYDGRSENLGGQSIIKDLLKEQNLLLVGPKSASAVPTPVAQATKRKFELSEKRIQESEKRRKIEEKKQTAESISHDLFVAPIKLDRNPTSVEKVLGRFDQTIVDKVCIGSDYESQNIYGRGRSYSHFYDTLV